MMDDLYYSGGINVGVLSNTSLVIEPFALQMWQGVAAGWGSELVSFTDEVDIDLTTVGLNGRDSGLPGTPPDGCYSVWMVHNPTTDVVGAIVTKTQDIRSIVFPSGFTNNRKLMYGQPVVGGRALPNHTANWPMPTVMFTDHDTMMTVYSTGNAPHWAAVDLSGYIPENARLGWFSGRIAGIGSIWISPVSNVPNPYWKTLLENQSGVGGVIPCRVDGSQTLYFWFGGTGVGQLILRGFSMTEVS